MLPFQIPDSVLAQMRDQAEETMQDAINIYNITYSYNEYGKQVPLSGLYTSTSGLLAKPRESDYTRLVAQRIIADSTRLEQTRLLLLPYNVLAVNRAQIVRAKGTDWRILEIDDSTTEQYRVYTKLIIARREYVTLPDDIT